MSMELDKQHFLASKPKQTCCMSPLEGIRIIGVISCVSGLFITCLTLVHWSKRMQRKEDFLENLVDQDHFTTVYLYLLVTGISSATVSIWLLCNERSRTATKFWAAVHIFDAVITTFMFSRLMNEPEFDRLMQVLLSLVGINLIIVICNCLIVIEFLIHPLYSEDY